ncbi:1-acyl-sn-glycerol-3-phosphate acyltransferase epsilon-like [Crassostrea angulata]|uniref:1-acyl-sn-glycerol-3-phosphate acyltransferase epsilon-like n=1 Tax=Magallana angulata TaxID=2784310 RepID=UPI0022B15950|nr:1-acyl-sn-glycerol-3-phosphate acyltransferase epsilon-like [Crassostrea angulata]
MLSILVHAQSVRWLFPAAAMLSAAPIHITVWTAVRLLTLPLPRRVYRALDDSLYSTYQRYVLFFMRCYTGAEIYTYGDTDDAADHKENAVFICNHQSTMDWVVANMVALQHKSLGHVRYVIKDGLKYFPLYGFYFKQHDCIFVRRGNFSKESMEKQVKRIAKRKEPVWMIIFPEGTRFNPMNKESIKKSRTLAEKKGVVPMEHVLPPKMGAMHVCLEQLRGHATVIYDVTIAFSNTTTGSGQRTESPGMPEFLMQASPEIHLNVEKIKITDVPTDGDQLQAWLDQQFQKKDRLLSHFYSLDKDKAGKFPGKKNHLQITLAQTVPAAIFYNGCLCLMLTTPATRSLYWKISLFGTVLGCVWMSFRSQA